MSDTPWEIQEGVQPELEEIVSSFECLSISPTPQPPFVVSKQLKDTEQDLRGQRKKYTIALRVGRERGRRRRPIANVQVMEVVMPLYQYVSYIMIELMSYVICS